MGAIATEATEATEVRRSARRCHVWSRLVAAAATKLEEEVPGDRTFVKLWSRFVAPQIAGLPESAAYDEQPTRRGLSVASVAGRSFVLALERPPRFGGSATRGTSAARCQSGPFEQRERTLHIGCSRVAREAVP